MGGASRRSEAAHATIILNRIIRGLFRLIYVKICWTHYTGSEAAGDAGTSSRPSDNADEAAPPAPEGLVGPLELDWSECINIGNAAYLTISGAHQQTLP